MGRGVGQNGVAVGFRLGDRSHSDRIAGTRAVLHHDRLAELRRNLLQHQTRHDVGRAAGGQRHDHADRLRRPALRPGMLRQERRCQRGGGEVQEIGGERSASRSFLPFCPASPAFRHKMQRVEERTLSLIGRQVSPWDAGGSCGLFLSCAARFWRDISRAARPQEVRSQCADIGENPTSAGGAEGALRGRGGTGRRAGFRFP